MSEVSLKTGSDNVFADIGIGDAGEYLAKADLAREVIRLVAKKKLKSAAATTLLGINQSGLSAIKSGTLAGATIEQLIRFLDRLGATVTLSISEKNPTANEADTSSRTAGLQQLSSKQAVRNSASVNPRKRSTRHL